jgi:formylglycine-generating enzyme required for sulfatase activity
VTPDLDDGFAFTAPVGHFPAGAAPCGALDMTGNVAEWCRDWFGEYTLRVQAGDGLRLGSIWRRRITRGGSYRGDASVARSANRSRSMQVYRGVDVGVRPARTLDL